MECVPGYPVKSIETRHTPHSYYGLASEAVRTMCHWASGVFSLDTILGITAARNIASRVVLLRAGFPWQKNDVMQFHEVQQPVMCFAFSRKP